jgi:hypothetical protein
MLARRASSALLQGQHFILHLTHGIVQEPQPAEAGPSVGKPVDCIVAHE